MLKLEKAGETLGKFQMQNNFRKTHFTLFFRSFFLILLLRTLFIKTPCSLSDESIPRVIEVGISTPVLLSDPLPPARAYGLGVNGNYEFLITPKFGLGIHLAYRYFLGSEPLRQLGYGLALKHYVFEKKPEFSPYIQYGLLINVSHQSGHDGTGTSHDTQLAVGSDFECQNQKLFAEFSYHFSMIAIF